MVNLFNKIKGSETFKLLLQIKILEMSIEELQKIQEENDKMEEEEKKLTAEEMSKKWGRLTSEVNLLAKNRFQVDKRIYKFIPRLEIVHKNIQHRINRSNFIICNAEAS